MKVSSNKSAASLRNAGKLYGPANPNLASAPSHNPASAPVAGQAIGGSSPESNDSPPAVIQQPSISGFDLPCSPVVSSYLKHNKEIYIHNYYLEKERHVVAVAYNNALHNIAAFYGYRVYTASELADLMKSPYQNHNHSPSWVGKMMKLLFQGCDEVNLESITVKRERRRVKKKCGDGGSQLQYFYTISKAAVQSTQQTLRAAVENTVNGGL